MTTPDVPPDGFRWQVPAQFNIARECCTRWADDDNRIALRYVDAGGQTLALTFCDVQQAANRLANVLAAQGVMRGDRVALLMSQRPELAIALVACAQMGAIAMPLSSRLAGDVMAARLTRAAVRVAIADAAAQDGLLPQRAALPLLRHVIGVDAVNDVGVRAWTTLLPLASDRYVPCDTAADSPALLVHDDGAGGAAEAAGVVVPQRALAGVLPGFACVHGADAQAGGLLWSALDAHRVEWILGALLAAWSRGEAVLMQAGAIDAEHFLSVAARHAVSRVALDGAQLEQLAQASAAVTSLRLTSLAVHGAMPSAALCEGMRALTGTTPSALFGTTEFPALAGARHDQYELPTGALGRAFPGHELSILDANGAPVADGTHGELCVAATCHGHADPVFFGGYWQDEAATRARVFGAGTATWGRTGVTAWRDGDGCFRHDASGVIR